MPDNELGAAERKYYADKAEREKAGAVPVGACIVRPGSRGIIGIRSRAEKPADPDPETLR